MSVEIDVEAARQAVKDGIQNLIYHLAKKFGVQYKDVPRIIVFGRRAGENLNEESVGKLIGIVLGLVIFEPDRIWFPTDQEHVHWLEIFVGRMERSEVVEGMFCLRPLFPDNGGSFSLTKLNERDSEIFPCCSMYISGNRGNEQEFSCLAIDSSRWATMSAWLDKWLPKS